MKKITFYRTRSYGGMEGRDLEVRNFETEEMAREDAIKDTWNDGFTLYKVTMTFNGTITEESERVDNIECGRDIARKKRNN